MKYVLLILAFALAGCSDRQGAIKSLDNAGYTNISITGVNVFSCSEGDIYRTAFKAKNINGKYVTGTVCAGMLKGSTIRF